MGEPLRACLAVLSSSAGPFLNTREEAAPWQWLLPPPAAQCFLGWGWWWEEGREGWGAALY